MTVAAIVFGSRSHPQPPEPTLAVLPVLGLVCFCWRQKGLLFKVVWPPNAPRFWLVRLVFLEGGNAALTWWDSSRAPLDVGAWPEVRPKPHKGIPLRLRVGLGRSTVWFPCW